MKCICEVSNRAIRFWIGTIFVQKSTIAGGAGERLSSPDEIAAAKFQGRHIAAIALKPTG